MRNLPTCAGALALLLAAQIAQPVNAADKPLTAPEFDALTAGTTFDTFAADTVYGIEKFLPGHRSIWKDDRGCMNGTWAQVGQQICFSYDDDPANPDCWTYYRSEDGIIGYLRGDESTAPIRLRPSVSTASCNDFIGT